MGTNTTVGSGLAGQLVALNEATYGVAPTLTSPRTYEFKSEGLKLKKNTVQGQGLHGSAGSVPLYDRAARRVLTTYEASGPVVMDLPGNQLGFWLQHMIGSYGQVMATPTQLGTTGVYQQIHQPGSLQGKSFTVQKGAPAVDGTVEPFTYVGGKLESWQLTCEVNMISELQLTLDFRNELAGAGNGDPLNVSVPTLAVPAYTSGMQLFHFREATLFTGGTPTLSAGATLGSPGVPASGTPQTNTFGQNALVTITGGTITAVLVNGVQVGTSAGAYQVPNLGTISITYSVAPTWTWTQPVVSLAGETTAGNVKKAVVTHAVALDKTRIFLGNNGFKSEQLENNFRKIGGSFDIEWLSSEAMYNAFAADTTTSLELKWVGPIIGTSGTNTMLLDLIIPNIKLDGDTPSIGGPGVVTQAVPFTGLDDQATTQMQFTYQSTDTAL